MSDPMPATGGDSRAALRIRAAGRADVPAVLALWGRARSANASTPDTPQALTRLLETMPARCSSPTRTARSSAR